MHNSDSVGFATKDAMDADGDRLSALPDDLIHKIFSFISIKDAIGTSVLSSRWRLIWTSMPCLNFEKLDPGPHISKFISKVLSHRDNQIHVSSVNLLLGRSVADDKSVKRVLDCAFSHKVQQLSVKCAPGDTIGVSCSFIATPMWDLPFLTTLHLHCVILSDDNDGLFSKCSNLKNLFLKWCHMEGKVLNICHPRLSNLTLKYTPADIELDEVVNVVAPQLTSLTIKKCEGKHLVDAPGLTSLVIEGYHPWQLYTPSGFHSLEKVRLHMYDSANADPRIIVCLLQQLSGVKLLTLNLGILQRLFSIKVPPKSIEYRQSRIKSPCLYSAMELNQQKACVFNTKIFKFIPNIHVNVYLEVRAQEKETITSQIKINDTSPSAIFPMVSREELTAMGDMESAQIFVEHLSRFVNQCKANSNSDTDKARMDEHGKGHVELQLNLGKIMALVEHRKIVELENCRMMRSLRKRYIRRRQGPQTEIHPMITWLQEMRELFERIEGLMTQLSASKRAVLQPLYLGFCEDAVVLTNNMLGWMNTEEYQETNVPII